MTIGVRKYQIITTSNYFKTFTPTQDKIPSVKKVSEEDVNLTETSPR